ncbi:hypothetical protein CBL_20136 [Carabus blaptoides fortunei]
MVYENIKGCLKGGRGAVTNGTVPEVIHIQALHSYDNGLLAEGEVDGVRCHMVVDTGANVTLVHQKIIKLAQPPRSQGQPIDNMELRTVIGERAPITEQRKINIHIGHTSVMHTVYIANIEDDVILGLDFLRRYRCVIDPVNNLLRIGHEDVMLENRNQNDHMRCQLICASTLEIPPMTEILVPIFCATSSSKKLMIVEPQLLNGCTPGLIVARAVMHVDNQETALRIMNVATTPRMISKNTVLAFCEPVGAVGVTGCHEDNCNSLKLFCTKQGDIGRCKLAKHRIDVGDTQPIKQPPRRLPVSRRQEATELVTKMERDGIIEPSTSPWSSLLS